MKKNSEIINIYPKLVQPFYVISITLLSLLLPLSFLLLSRLSRAHYVLSLAASVKQPPKTLLYTVFLQTDPTILHALVLLVSLAALIHALTSRAGLLTEYPGLTFQPCVRAAWLILCTFQLCVGLGIEANIQARVQYGSAAFADHSSMMISKLLFLVGLHETMMYWCRTVVRPVVDNTVYGGQREERWPERWVVSACFGMLSWWRLRDEVVALVEVKRDRMMKIQVGMLLYYLTVAIGISRFIRALIWFYIKFLSWDDDDDDEQEQDSDVQLQHIV